MLPDDLMLYLGAIALGALHSFEPGHGKTVIAAYMIGTRGRTIDGIILGLIVTFTHTFSVIILGIIAQMMAQSYTEAQLHAWMGLASSILILSVGLWMLKQRLSGHTGHTHFHLFGKGHHHHHGHDHHSHSHDHDHSHGHDHSHDHDDHSHGHHSHDHSHSHDHDHGHRHGGKEASAGDPAERYNMTNLLLLGISGGLVPCPAGIATLLAAIAAGKVAKGVTLTLFFSLGMGLVMMTIGVVLAGAGKLTGKITENMELSRRLGILSAIIITVLGCYTLYHSVNSILSL